METQRDPQDMFVEHEPLRRNYIKAVMPTTQRNDFTRQTVQTNSFFWLDAPFQCHNDYLIGKYDEVCIHDLAEIVKCVHTSMLTTTSNVYTPCLR
jgi:hypothetical protein